MSALVPDESRLAPDDRLRLAAIRAMVLRDFDRAIGAYTELAAANPEDAGDLVDLGRAQEAAGRLADARRTYERATALNSQLASGFLRLGSVLGEGGNLTEALAAFDEADRLYALSSNIEGRVETLLERGAALDSVGHFEATAKAAEEASRLAQQAGLVPQVIRAGFQSGSAQVGAGQFAAGLATLRTYVNQALAAGLEGTAAGGLIDMAGTLLANGKVVEAEAALVQARAIADERSLTRTAMRASTQRAALELDRNEPAAALALLEEPLRYYAQSRHRRLEAVALTIAARAHQELRQYSTAGGQLEKVLAFADESHNDELRAQAQSSLATMAFSQGRLPAAVEHRAAAIALRRSLRDTETLPYDLTNLADVLIRLGRSAEASAPLDEVEAGIAAGTGAYPSRARRVMVLRALQAVTDGRFAAARQHVAPLVRAAPPPTDESARLGLMLDAVAAVSTGQGGPIPAVPAALDHTSLTGRDLRWWRVIALAAAGDRARASSEVEGLLQSPPPPTATRTSGGWRPWRPRSRPIRRSRRRTPRAPARPSAAWPASGGRPSPRIEAATICRRCWPPSRARRRARPGTDLRAARRQEETQMTTELLTGLGVAVAVAAALYWFLTFRRGGDDGPIRVKGGSVTIDAPQDWVSAGQGFRLKRNNPRLTKATVDVTLNGVSQPGSPVTGQVVHLALVDPGASGPAASRLTITVPRGVDVANPRFNASAKRLTSRDPGTYMTEVRVVGGGPATTFGPYTAAQSKLLIIDIIPG